MSFFKAYKQRFCGDEHMDKNSVNETGVARQITKLLPRNIASKAAPPTEDLVAAQVKCTAMKQNEI